MGFDLDAIAVRLDAEPIKQLLRDPAVFQDAVSRPPFTDETVPGPLPPLSQALCAAHPGAYGWDTPYPDRTYQAAEFVLNPEPWRTGADPDALEHTLAHRIVHGDAPLARHAVGGQGRPWRGSRATFLRRAADTIESIDPAAARRDFSLGELCAHGVYKVFERDDEDELFYRIMTNLGQLGRYYRTIAGRGLDIIVSCD